MGPLQQLLSPSSYVGKADSWLAAGLIALLAVLCLALVKRIIVRRLQRRSTGTEAGFNDVLTAAFANTRSFFILGVGLWAGAEYVELSQKAARWLHASVSVVVLLQLGLWLHIGIQRFAEIWGRERPADAAARTMATGVAFIAKLCVWAVLFVMAMSSLGFEVSALIAGLGVGGVAAALAVQNILGDMLASLSMFFDRPFDLGDFIVVGQEKGRVEQIGLRSTRLRALDGQQIVFANGDLIKSRIHNFKRMTERRVELVVFVDLGTSPEQLESLPPLLKSAVEGREGLRFDRAHFSKTTLSAFEFELVYFVLSGDMLVNMDHRQAVNLALLARFREAGIALARALPPPPIAPVEPARAPAGARS